jgi:hypothetical protein
VSKVKKDKVTIIGVTMPSVKANAFLLLIRNFSGKARSIKIKPIRNSTFDIKIIASIAISSLASYCNPLINIANKTVDIPGMYFIMYGANIKAAVNAKPEDVDLA